MPRTYLSEEERLSDGPTVVTHGTSLPSIRLSQLTILLLQFFDSVTILFSDVVTFTEICSRLTPIEVVQMLNAMYSLFDQLTDKHGVYKASF